MIETSLDLLWSSSTIFVNLRKLFGNVQKMFRGVLLVFGTVLENLRKYLGSGQKS